MNAADHPAGEELTLSDVTLLVPVPRPGKVICIGLNDRDHAAEGGNPIPDYPAVFMRGANGGVRQDGGTADMIFNVATSIVPLSEAMTLEPGDVTATGTPAGVGYARKPTVFMREGDRIEVGIGKIGTAANVVARRNGRPS